MRRSAVAACLAVLLLVLATPAAADYQAGMEAYARGDYSAAAREFAAVVQAHPDDPKFAIAFHMLGLTQLMQGENDAAVANLAHAVKLDGSNAEFALGLGQALFSNNETERALGVLKGIDASGLPDGKRTPHALLLTSVALKAGRPGDAVDVLQARLAESPEEAILHRALGSAYYRMGRRDDAFEAFADAFAADPKDTDSGKNAVKIGLAQAARASEGAERSRLYERTVEVATALAEHAPGAESATLAGAAAFGSGDRTGALGWYEKARAASPDDPEVLSHLGQTLASLDRTDEAVKVYEHALASSPEPDLERRLNSRLGGLFASQLDFDRAIPAYEKAGNNKRASELRTLRKQYGEAVAQRRELAAQVDKLEEMASRLDALGEQEGASKMRERIAYVNRQIEAIDRNLARVRQVLQQD